MRLLGRLLFGLLLLALAAVLYPRVHGLFQVPPPAPAVVKQLGLEARASTVYFLAESDWLTFPIVNQSARLRILTHAGVAPDTAPEIPLRYTLRYELLDADRQPLKTGTYTHETHLPLPRFKEGMPFPRNLYTDRALAVAAGQSFNVQLEALPQTAYLRLRLTPLDAPLGNVAVRVYYEERMSKGRASVAWERLSRVQKERLAQGVIYPPPLLTPQERLNVLAHQWQPVGPLGTNPAQGVLFNLQGGEPAINPADRPEPEGLYVAPERKGVLPIQTSGRYRLEFTPQLDSGVTPELMLQNVTEAFQAPVKERVTLTGHPPASQQAFSPGLVVVTPNQPGRLDIRSLEVPGKRTVGKRTVGKSVLPEPGLLRAWRVQPGRPLQFSLLPGDAVDTAMKLDLRAHGDGVALPADRRTQVRYRWRDARGRTLDQGVLEASATPSRFDRVAETPEVADLSDPVSFFLRPPSGAVRLEVESDQKILANAYTRPADLPHRTRVPQDYYPWRGDEPAQPSWFILQPRLSAPLAQTSRVLHLQSRPIERDPDLLAGRYRWDSLDPQRSARGARILMPLRGEEMLRPSGLPGYFEPLTQGAQSVELVSPGVTRQLEPQLIYLRENAEPFSLQLRLGGTTLRRALIGKRGQVSLPPISPGRHEAVLETTDTAGTFLMNYRYPGDTGYIRRLAFRLEDTPLRYRVEKRAGGDQTWGDQIVGARFYPLEGAGAQSTLQVRITPQEVASAPTREWTHLERLYYLTSTPEAPSSRENSAGTTGNSERGYVLDQQRERLNPSQSLFINLGSDVPDGPMDVEFSLTQGAPGYLVFYEIWPGEHERTRRFREEEE